MYIEKSNENMIKDINKVIQNSKCPVSRRKAQFRRAFQTKSRNTEVRRILSFIYQRRRHSKKMKMVRENLAVLQRMKEQELEST
jgi:hypothetical protein